MQQWIKQRKTVLPGRAKKSEEDVEAAEAGQMRKAMETDDFMICSLSLTSDHALSYGFKRSLRYNSLKKYALALEHVAVHLCCRGILLGFPLVVL